MTQLRYFIADVKAMLGKYKSRLIYIWLTRSFLGVFVYRFERSLYLIFNRYYTFVRLPFVPFSQLLQSYSNIEIHYKADIKGGLKVLHPSVGVVVSGKSIIGKNLILTGGNVIGVKRNCGVGDFVIGDDRHMGANATVIGPVVLGDSVTIGASACVNRSFVESEVVLVGVPAKKIV